MRARFIELRKHLRKEAFISRYYFLAKKIEKTEKLAILLRKSKIEAPLRRKTDAWFILS
jgi:hypothetical protein